MAGMEPCSRSAKIRNYAIAGFFITLAIFAAAFFLNVFVLWGFGAAPASIWSECTNEYANVFIGANEDLKNVKCVALDREFLADSEVVLGDLSKNDEDVCRFRLSKNTTEPLRFEVRYNNSVKREVCDWQQYPQGAD